MRISDWSSDVCSSDLPTDHNVLLVIGAAGGVGSILTQLARTLTGMTVIGTASRAETRDWVLEHGAHHVIDHRQPWAPHLAEIGIQHVTHVADLNQSAAYVPRLEERRVWKECVSTYEAQW